MSRVITLSGLRLGAEDASGCGAQHVKVVIDGKEYCQSVETGKIYDPVTGDEYKGEAKGSRLLNYAVSIGVGAVVGLLIASSKSRKVSMRALGAGAGGLAGAALLAMTWPKAKAKGA